MEIRKKLCSELMECLTPSISFKIFMDNYFTSFCLPTHLGVNSIRATRVLNKNRLHKCTIIAEKQLQKRNVAAFNSTHKAKRPCNFGSSFQNDSIAIYIASSESSEPKRFVQCWNKPEKQFIQKQ